MSFTNLSRAVLVPLAVAAMLSLSACGGSEQGQRKAFIEFLQTRIIDKPGLRVPKLTEPEKEKLGQYVPQFEIIASYNNDVSAITVPVMNESSTVLRLSSAKDVMESRSKLIELRSKVKASRESTEARLAKANTDFAALNQLDDLKPVYANAYKRTVTVPAEALLKFFAVIDEALGSYESMASFLDANKANIKFSGLSVEVADPKLLEQFNARLTEINAVGRRMQETQGELRKLIGK